MRLTSVLILAAIVGGIGYVAIFKRDWFFGKVEEVQRDLAGYAPAKSAAEALEFFSKAIRSRDYKTAATYVEGTYAAQLEKAHAEAREFGQVLDGIDSWCKKKKYLTKKSATLLFVLDPFPTNFHAGAAKEEGDKATGTFESDPITEYEAKADLKGTDNKICTNPLGYVCSNPVAHPYNPLASLNLAKVALTRVGEGDKKSWKIRLDVPAQFQSALGYYLTKLPRYKETLNTFKGELNNNRYGDHTEVERELTKIIARSAVE